MKLFPTAAFFLALNFAATGVHGAEAPLPPATIVVWNRNEASVDSELAGLGFLSKQISGAQSNPYFQSFRRISEFEGPALMLVCRLDAPSAAAVRRMITDAIETEKTGLWGRAYIDGAHNAAPGLGVGDTWLAEIRKALRKAGVPVIYENEPAN